MDVFLITVSIVLVLLTYLFVSKKKSRYHELINKIPESPAYPVVGHLFEMLKSPDYRFKKYRERCLNYYPIFKLRIVDKVFVSILQPEDVEQLLKNMKHLTKSSIYDVLHSWLNDGLLTSSGAKWQRRRKILTPAFHFTILQGFVNIFVSEAEQLVLQIEKECHKPSIDVLQPVTHFALNSIAETSMGLDLNSDVVDPAGYKAAVSRMGGIVVARVSRPWLHFDKIYSWSALGKDEKQTVDVLHSFTRTVIEKKNHQVDLDSYSERKRLAMLDLLLKYQAEGADISEEGIREEVDTFMFAGHDTTAMALSYSLLCLANYPEAQEQILEEVERVIDPSKPATYNELQQLKVTERIIKECLRVFPTVPMISRILGEDMETVSGYTLPKGVAVNVMIYDMHHDPRLFPDPEKFDPDRFLPENIQKRHPFSYIPFSAGSRNCIGQKYALLELKAGLSAIVRKFVLEKVDDVKDITIVAGIILKSKGPIRVKFVPRS